MSHAADQVGGRLIVLEGGEGAGKSTAIAVAEQSLRDAGHPPLLTREPGGTPLGEAVRELLLTHREEGMGARAEALLVFAARAEHLARVVEPALAAGRWVLSDRFTDASYAYQGAGRGLGAEAIATLERWTQGERRPDLVLVLDLPVALGRQRVSSRGLPADRFEAESDGFFERVRQCYRDRAAANPARYRLIDAGQPRAVVAAQVRAAIGAALPALEARR
jgi:dTMP kinase